MRNTVSSCSCQSCNYDQYVGRFGAIPAPSDCFGYWIRHLARRKGLALLSDGLSGPSSMPIEVQSRTLFLIFVVCTGVYYYCLYALWPERDWVYFLYALLGLLVPYCLWMSTYVITIEPQSITVRRLFGLIAPIVVPTAQIAELRSRPNSNGQMTRFEVWTNEGRVVQLHIFQSNYLSGVAAIRGLRADLSEQVLSTWSL